ncbi:conserved hypothetical protein [Theileria equi strain WA]|uniref:Serine aminopeptidase S33 domain-containing protein n=1 Tax=Theileria equi strain WA TaxID=1537102 RepID=L1LCR6_THEEQ|nr:conserved hypothetical protein [Theileria equi strain WA]EKX73040.1 conserved hypothetical protein [Theileria equi strain WA]|eukprot:XP_004832492.1 conserved hypothetical protein [Theileria equi strain WA]
MQIVLILWVLLLGQTCSLETPQGPEEEAEEEVILDITKPNPSFIDTIARNPYGVVTKIYVPKKGYKIFSVVEKEEPIWQTDGLRCEHVAVLTRGESGTHVNVYLRDENGERVCLYYERDDEANDWDEATEGNFYSIFHQRALSEAVFDSIELDVTKRATCEMYFVADSQKLPFLLFAPNVSYRIKSVKNGTVIWNAGANDQGCIYASFYPRDIPTLAYLVIQSLAEVRDLYYKKVGNSWTSVDKNGYLADLKQAGFDESQVSDEITMDIANVDSDCFYITKYPINSYGVNSYVPSLGFKLKSIAEGNADIWKVEEGSSAKCINVNVVYKDAVFCALFILVEDPKNGRHVLYFVKNDKEWKNVSKDEYYDRIAKENGLEPLGKIENPKVVMSSFRNKDGLKIATYSSGVENSKGDVVLVHGIRSHFKSEFCSENVEWNFDNFGFPISPDIGGQFMDETHVNALITGHRHLFEHAYLEGMDAFEASPRYEYSQSLTAFFNGLGYSVYGLDLQSHGLSESFSPTRCHAREFINFALDVIQFVSIVKRGKFEDSSEKWNEEVVYENIPMDRKVFLLGNSMGGNIVFQAVQEFYKHAKEEARFVDGLISIAGMFSLDHHADTTTKKVAKHLLGAAARVQPKKENPCDKLLNYGEFFELFTRYRDPFFYAKRLTLETANALLNACNDVKKPKNLANYPKDLPTLFLHTDNDFLCDPKGPREMVNIHLKDHSDVKLVEFKASTHFLTVPHSTVLTQKYLKELLDKAIEA